MASYRRIKSVILNSRNITTSIVPWGSKLLANMIEAKLSLFCEELADITIISLWESLELLYEVKRDFLSSDSLYIVYKKYTLWSLEFRDVFF